MRITLQIENVDRLETGGQVSYSCTDRGFDIGRHDHLDWSLPDPQRVISGKHCEVRFEDGQFVLLDISTNGTFLNGSPNRMDKPHALRSGDRLMIGDYVIVVSLEVDSKPGLGAPGPSVSQDHGHSQAWNSPMAAAPAPQDPSWPSAPSPGSHSAYPQEDSAGGPWVPPAVGMEGRHAPPSSTPGIGTPVDDVWSREGHGAGTADPALYDPHAGGSAMAPARPAQADPLDHLAQQPDLQPAQNSPVFAEPSQNSESQSPFPQQPGSGAQSQPDEPLFKMPDFGATDAGAAEAAKPQAVVSAPSQSETSPFPEVPPDTADRTISAEVAEETSAAVVVEPAPKAVIEPAGQSEPPVQQEVGSSAAAASVSSASSAPSDILQAFAEGAGIPVTVLEGREPEEFAREIGAILQGVTGDMMGLLQARSQVKAMTRNANRTLISRSGNNALKFSPTPQMALQTMLSENAEDNGYLPMAKAMTAAFKDIQKHHVWTYAAMQKAAARFDETMSPKALEGEGQVSKSAFGNQKAKLWDRLEERWTSLSGAYDDGVVGVFTQYFTESYEELSSDDPDQTSG